MTRKILQLKDYLHLAEEEQLALLYNDGVYVGKRIVNNKPVIPFQLYSFYVEVHYLEYRKVIDHIKTAASAEILLPYLDQIHVRDLPNTGDKEK